MRKINLEHITIDKKLIKKVADRRKHNATIADHYRHLAWESGQPSAILRVTDESGRVVQGIKELAHVEQAFYESKALSLTLCNQVWDIDYYRQQNVKDFVGTILCKDKFCLNCKVVRQAILTQRFAPYLDKYGDRLYHMVLTQPNCTGDQLKDVIKRIQKNVGYLFKLFRGNTKVKDLDLTQWQVIGGVRSLEVTINDNGTYHPHVHIALVMNRPLSDKTYENVYSKKFGRVVRTFSYEEIIIQRIWYLLWNGQKVTVDNIDSCEGYSCMIEPWSTDGYAELFKYLTKSHVSDDDDLQGELITYEQFKVLYYALYRIRQVQGYGVLYRITDDLDKELVREIYQQIRDQLRGVEQPEAIKQRPESLLIEDTRIISFKAVYRYVNELEIEKKTGNSQSKSK